MRKQFTLVLTLFVLILGFHSTTILAWSNPIKTIEVTTGWDKYILAWGNRVVPDENRWVALRSSQKKKKQMGFFWDLPGNKVEKFNKPKIFISLYHLNRKFQAKPKVDRKYRFMPVAKSTKNRDDLGYFFIQCGTGYFVQQSGGKGSRIWLNKGPITEKSFHWKIKNVGKNKFVFKNRKSGMVIDAKGGNGGKDGVQLVAWPEVKRAANQQWEMILIAEGKEVKTTTQLATRSANWVKEESVVQAKRNKTLKKIVDQVEINAGWDRYIYAWGDKFIPKNDHWTAIRNTKKKKGQMGFFWDIPGSGKAIEGANKKLQTWELAKKFQASPANDRRYKFIPIWKETKNQKDFGFYYVLSKTGFFLQAPNDKVGTQVVLNSPNRKIFDGKTYPKDTNYHWNIKNVGKNKFLFVNRKNKMAIDSKGGNGGKNGVSLILSPEKIVASQEWEFILIAQGKEVKTTSQLAEKRATEILKATEEFTKQAFGKVEELVMSAINDTINNIKNIFKDGLIEFKYDKKNNSIYFRIGFDDPLGPLKDLKENFMDEFAKVELGKIEFNITRDEIELSFVNTLASMGYHVDFIVTIAIKWHIGIDGFEFYDLRLKRLTLPLLPNSATEGVRKKVRKLLKPIHFKITDYPGKKLLVKSFDKVKKSKSKSDKVKIPGIIIEDIQKTDTKFLIKIKFTKDGRGIKIENSNFGEPKEEKDNRCKKLKGKKRKKCLRKMKRNQN